MKENDENAIISLEEELTDEELKQVSGGFILTPVLEVASPIPIATTTSSGGGGTSPSGWNLATNKVS